MTMRGSHGQDTYDGTDTGTDSGADTPERQSVFDGRTIPAGMKGTVQSILSRDQYEIIET